MSALHNINCLSPRGSNTFRSLQHLSLCDSWSQGTFALVFTCSRSVRSVLIRDVAAWWKLSVSWRSNYWLIYALTRSEGFVKVSSRMHIDTSLTDCAGPVALRLPVLSGRVTAVHAVWFLKKQMIGLCFRQQWFANREFMTARGERSRWIVWTKKVSKLGLTV